MTEYVVVKGKSLLTRDREQLLGGTILSNRGFTEEQLERLRAAGFVRKLDEPEPEDAPPPMLKPESEVEMGPGKDWVEPKVGRLEEELKKEKEAKLAPELQKEEKLEQPKKWNLHPDTLSEKGLEELNVMILERDPHAFDRDGPYETREEATAHLTMDIGR